MANYIIIICGKCGGHMLAKNSQKSRNCPYCGSRVALEKAKRVAHAENANKASVILRRLKEESAIKHGKARLQRQF